MRNKSIVSNVFYHLKAIRKWDNRLFYVQIFYVITSLAASIIGVCLPTFVVDGLSGKWAMDDFLICLMIMGIILLISSVISAGLYQFMYRNGMALTMYYDKECFIKVMDMPFWQLNDKGNKEKRDNVWNVLRSEYGIRNAVVLLPDSMVSFLEVMIFGIILAKANFVLVISCCVPLVFHILSLRKTARIHSRFHNRLSKLTAQTAYINREIMNKSAAADLRLFHLSKWIMNKYDQAMKGMKDIYGRIHNAYFARAVLDGVFQFGVQCFGYSYLIYHVYRNTISIAECVFLITIFRQFTESLKRMIDQLLQFNPVNTSINYIREFLAQICDSPNKFAEAVGSLDQIDNIELKNVSFMYPGSKDETLSNIDLNISKGERIAILGLNGAGKTTLVKLLCGLFEPTSGEIFMNGVSANSINPNERQRAFSALFQDSNVLPVDVYKNICGTNMEKRKDLFDRILKLSDMKDVYEGLPQRGKTLLVKEVNKDAIDLSGGEKQKLLFARALYREAGVIILDEPTSALDPVAENKLYNQFAEATEDKTVIFISHRMASTRFCDRIVLLENGRILESGTHYELIKRKGNYYELFNAQSKYYRKNEQT